MEKPDRDLTPYDRGRKAAYVWARRALEHEFIKTRTHRSPREMLHGPADALLSDKKPIFSRARSAITLNSRC
jgi:hypothetical protein